MSTGSDGPLGFGEQEPEPEPRPGAGPRRPDHPSQRPAVPPTNRYTWFVGIVAIVLVVYVGINTLSNGSGSTGVKVGHVVPPFAAPLATKGLVGDANVSAKGGGGSAGHVAACSIHRPDVFTVCDAYATRPLVLVFVGSRGKQCVHELDAIQRVAVRYPGIATAAVAIRGDRGDLRDLIRDHGWSFPVAYDRDNAVANLYGVVVCPQITYIRRGGRSAGTSFGVLSETELAARFAALRAGRPIPRK